MTRAFRRGTAGLILMAMVWGCLITSFVWVINDLPSPEQWMLVLKSDKISETVLFFVICFLVQILRGVRWGVLLKPKVTFLWKHLILVFGWCFILSALSPFRSGELVRAWWVKKEGGSGMAGLGVLVIERTADLIALLAVLCLVIARIPTISSVFPISNRVLIAGIIVIFSGLVMILPAISRNAEKATQYLKKNGEKSLLFKTAEQFQTFMESVSPAGRWLTYGSVLGLSVLIWGFLLCGFFVYLKAFFPNIHPISAAAVLCFVNLAGIVWIAPGNMGAYEMAAVIGLKGFDIPISEALVAAVGLHAVVLSATIGYGLFCRFMLRMQGLAFHKLV